MHILVYGAGAIGSFVAGQLHAAGHSVTLLAREQRLADIREQGVVLERVETGARQVLPIPVTDRLGPGDRYDLAVVAVRADQVPAVLPFLAAHPQIPNVLFVGHNVAGPEAMMTALDRERVLMGFVGVNGVRQGAVIRYTTGGNRAATVWLGEVDGRITHRLRWIAHSFRRAGLQVVMSENISAWLKTHAALAIPSVQAVYLAGGDPARLAKTRDGVVLMVRAMTENLAVLRALGIPITPSHYRWLARAPEPLQVAWVCRRLRASRASIAMNLIGHTYVGSNAAREEFKQLADEFRGLARAAQVPTPAGDQLYLYVNPTIPPMEEGRARLPMNWRSLWMSAGLFVSVVGGALAGVTLFQRQRRRARETEKETQNEAQNKAQNEAQNEAQNKAQNKVQNEAQNKAQNER